jgi:hypothetical protein
MIARMWRGATTPDDADLYAAYLDATAVAACREIPGNAGVVVLRRRVGDREEFTFISFWADEDSVRRFAGPDPGVAVVLPADDAFLVERETRVTHWSVAGDAPPLSHAA